MIVAIDGPAGVGKSSVAKRLAQELDLFFVNSGSFYRAITWHVLQAQTDFRRNPQKAVEIARSLHFDIRDERLFVNGEDLEKRLRTDEVDENVAELSAIPQIREVVNEDLRALGERHDIIVEGRDMTTVVFPHAIARFFLDASVEVRARRRHDQGTSNLPLEEIERQIRNRDKIDRNKEVGALRIGEGVHSLDTSHLTIDQVCATLVRKIHELARNQETQPRYGGE